MLSSVVAVVALPGLLRSRSPAILSSGVTLASRFTSDSVVTQSKLKLCELLYRKVEGICSKVHYSNPSIPASRSIGNHNRIVVLSTDGMAVIEEEAVMEVDAFMEMVKNDPCGLESLTLKKLRSLAKNMGVASKGNKNELVSALRAFSLQRDTGSISAAFSDSSSISLSLQTSKASLKRSSESMDLNDDSQDSVTDPEASENKLKVSGRKKPLVKDSGAVEDSGTKQPISCKKMNLMVESETTLTNVGPSLVMDEPWTVLTHKKAQDDWAAYNPKIMRAPPLSRDIKSVKIVSWNVNGLRALLKSSLILTLAEQEDFDILCLQETKIQEKDVKGIKDCLLHGYSNSYWACSISKLGYSGTAIISRVKPISVKYGLGLADHDSEGRLVTAEFDDFYLLTGYVPNSGDGLKRLTYRIQEWDPCLSQYIKGLEKSKPVILSGDLNCAHEEIDIYDPDGNRRSAGFTNEERQSFEANFLSGGLVDTFRKLHPSVVGYTYWGYRHRCRKTNKGWRLDYFLVSESISEKVYDSYILPDVMGSDHCPIGLILKV